MGPHPQATALEAMSLKLGPALGAGLPLYLNLAAFISCLSPNYHNFFVA
jgi:hypothetical protein